MLEKVKQYAMEKYAGEEALVEQFVEGFVKQAAETIQHQYRHDATAGGMVLDRMTRTNSPDMPVRGITDLFQEGISQAVGKGIGGLAVGLGIHGLNQAFSAATSGSLRTKFLEALEHAISMNPRLREEPKEKIVHYAETIFKFAPHVAGDANILSALLANAAQGHEGAGIDVMTIKTLGDLEARFIENRTAGGFTPKSYV